MFVVFCFFKSFEILQRKSRTHLFAFNLISAFVSGGPKKRGLRKKR
jgi:hypothetical protein